MLKREKGGFMGYSNVALKDKIMEMYPEIEKHGISTSIDFSDEKMVQKSPCLMQRPGKISCPLGR
jgi:hypothetical protein